MHPARWHAADRTWRPLGLYRCPDHDPLRMTDNTTDPQPRQMRHQQRKLHNGHKQLSMLRCHRARMTRLVTTREIHGICARACRTSAEDTTNSPPTCLAPSASPRRSLNCPWRSDPGPGPGPTRPSIPQRNSAIPRDNHKTPAHALCDQFWHGTGSHRLVVELWQRHAGLYVQ
jgi:hypothetical protein